MIKLAGISLNEAKPVDTITAFRLGKNQKKLADRNVADPEGLAWFMTGSEDLSSNMRITMYKIDLYQYASGGYELMTGASGRKVTHSPNPDGPRVGKRFVTETGGHYYSLPANGAWDFKILKSITIGQINKEVERLTSNKSFQSKMKYSPVEKWEQDKEYAEKFSWAKPAPEKPEPWTAIDEIPYWQDTTLLIRTIFKVR